MSVKELTHISLQVNGMTCSNCALGVEKFLKKEGLEGVSVDFANGEVEFELVNEKEVPRIIEGIESLGFEVNTEEEEGEESKGLSKLEKRFYFSAIFTLPLILHMFVSWHWLHNPWVQLVLTLPVFIVGMRHFGVSGWKSLKTGVPNMDVLIAIGASAAFGYSLYGTLMDLGPDFLFYETAASVIALVLLGNLMEERSVKKTTSSIRELARLQPQQARRIQLIDGQEVLEEVEIKALRVGDILQVNTGDRIPTDGLVLAGQGEVDESMISGESLPLAKEKGQELIGGTLLIQGNMQLRVNKTAQEGILSQIIKLVKSAQKDKPEIQKLADRISAYFVPIVLGISILTFLFSYFVFDVSIQASIIHSIAVLVISCPCAMGLATPTAVIVGIGRASKKGVLIRGGSTLGKFSKIQRIVFDKTGTLTTGEFKIAGISAPETDREEVEKVLRSIELYSSHPIAKSIQKELAHAGLKMLKQVEEEKGIGMKAEDKEGKLYHLGSARILEDKTGVEDHSLYLLRNGEFWAGIDLKDELRPGAKEMVAYFQGKGVETVLLSGDKQAKCEEVGKELGIDRIYSEQLPDQKLEMIKGFSDEASTAMVGDGVNDAPALSRAHVGISLAKATEVAMHASDVILSSDKIDSLIDLHKVSKHTVKTIHQNLFWAFFYNVMAIPLAAIGMLKPIIAAAAMAISDVIVIGNSLRLRIKTLT
ncbi:MAG: cation-translocating P-type ATPase [Bacteroidota bacterium]